MLTGRHATGLGGGHPHTLARLFQRYEGIELAVPYHQLEWHGRGSVRGLRSLPLRVTPRS